LWSLRVRAHISVTRGLFAFLNWLSLSWTVALACIQHLFRSESTFLRTPKEGTERTLRGAFNAARVETAFAVFLWSAPITLALFAFGGAQTHQRSEPGLLRPPGRVARGDPVSFLKDRLTSPAPTASPAPQATTTPAATTSTTEPPPTAAPTATPVTSTAPPAAAVATATP